MTWTVDPMRGANARLNQEKLAATAVNLTLDKYGVMRSTLYGNVPTDRFTNLWDMRSSQVHERLQQVLDREYRPRRPVDLTGLPEATVENAAELRRELPPQVVYRVPGDIDQLMRVDPQRAVDWRNEMREVLGTLMTRRSAIVGDDVATEGPIAIQTSVIDGPYDVTGFATELDELGNRESLFLLELKGEPIMRIQSIELWSVPLTLRSPFTTSFGTYRQLDRPFVIVRTTDGLTGIGEVPTLSDPAYKAECDPYAVMTSLQTFVVPAVFKRQKEIGSIGTVDDLRASYEWIKGAGFAKSGVEAAFWDIEGATEAATALEALGWPRAAVPGGGQHRRQHGRGCADPRGKSGRARLSAAQGEDLAGIRCGTGGGAARRRIRRSCCRSMPTRRTPSTPGPI